MRYFLLRAADLIARIATAVLVVTAAAGCAAPIAAADGALRTRIDQVEAVLEVQSDRLDEKVRGAVSAAVAAANAAAADRIAQVGAEARETASRAAADVDRKLTEQRTALKQDVRDLIAGEIRPLLADLDARMDRQRVDTLRVLSEERKALTDALRAEREAVVAAGAAQSDAWRAEYAKTNESISRVVALVTGRPAPGPGDEDAPADLKTTFWMTVGFGAFTAAKTALRMWRDHQAAQGARPATP